MENGTRVKVTLYMRNGKPMYEYGYTFTKDGVTYVDFDDYDKFDENMVKTSDLVPLDNFFGYEVVKKCSIEGYTTGCTACEG